MLRSCGESMYSSGCLLAMCDIDYAQTVVDIIRHTVCHTVKIPLKALSCPGSPCEPTHCHLVPRFWWLGRSSYGSVSPSSHQLGTTPSDIISINGTWSVLPPLSSCAICFSTVGLSECGLRAALWWLDAGQHALHNRIRKGDGSVHTIMTLFVQSA